MSLIKEYNKSFYMTKGTNFFADSKKKVGTNNLCNELPRTNLSSKKKIIFLKICTENENLIN